MKIHLNLTILYFIGAALTCVANDIVDLLEGFDGASGQETVQNSMRSTESRTQIPDPSKSVARVPASYDKIPIRVTVSKNSWPNHMSHLPFFAISETKPQLDFTYKPPEDYEISYPDLISYIKLPYGAPQSMQILEQKYTNQKAAGIYQLEVGKLYHLTGWGLHVDLHVEPGYQVLINGKPAKSAALYYKSSGDGITIVKSRLYWLQIVPENPPAPFGESRSASLAETFSWGVSAGSSYAGQIYSFNSYYNPREYQFEGDHYYGDFFVAANPIGFIGFHIGMRGVSLQQFLDKFRTSAVLNLPWYDEPDVNNTRIYGHGNDGNDGYEYRIKIVPHQSSGVADGFDIELQMGGSLEADGDPYRKYTFRVGSHTLYIKSYRGNDNLLKEEKITQSQTGEWILEVLDGQDVWAKTMLTITADETDLWDADIHQWGRVDNALRMSSHMRKRFKEVSWTANIEDYPGVHSQSQALHSWPGGGMNSVRQIYR